MRGCRCEEGFAEHGRVYAPWLSYKHVQLMQDAAQAAQQWQPYQVSCPASCLLSCGVQLEIDTYPWLRRKAVQVWCLGGCQLARQQDDCSQHSVGACRGLSVSTLQAQVQRQQPCCQPPRRGLLHRHTP